MRSSPYPWPHAALPAGLVQALVLPLLLPLMLAGLLALGLLLAVQTYLVMAGEAALVLLRLVERLVAALLPWPTARLAMTVGLACASAWLLSACGTAPSPVSTSPPVPAALLVPPQAPVLLQPESASRPPGTTTPSTPPRAPKTGRATSA